MTGWAGRRAGSSDPATCTCDTDWCASCQTEYFRDRVVEEYDRVPIGPDDTDYEPATDGVTSLAAHDIMPEREPW